MYSDGPFQCYDRDPRPAWGMLNSYRSGGDENIHWKYTTNKNDPECLSNWDYYAEDGTTLRVQVYGRITWERDTRSWCALPVYRTGGVEHYQWEYCYCYMSEYE